METNYLRGLVTVECHDGGGFLWRLWLYFGNPHNRSRASQQYTFGIRLPATLMRALVVVRMGLLVCVQIVVSWALLDASGWGVVQLLLCNTPAHELGDVAQGGCHLGCGC